MLVIVGVVGLCVHVFSLGYMHDDPAKARYFGGLSIFMASMVGIVLADNLFLMFIFWELVGFSSWVLIDHWYERPAAAARARRPSSPTGGRFGFLLGILFCYWSHGTVNLSDLAAQATSGHVIFSRAIPLLLFCGAVGKSAQIPLHVWLPDAMEGPTPVSALIHAATMVAAGIYMLCRIQNAHGAGSPARDCLDRDRDGVYAALCAIIQRDIKKVLAYSTLSQTGLHGRRLRARLLGGRWCARVHLAARGGGGGDVPPHDPRFFKGLLFLGFRLP